MLAIEHEGFIDRTVEFQLLRVTKDLQVNKGSRVVCVMSYLDALN